jgi:hypothetical protein
LIAHESPYLQTHGWGQIATMGDIREETLGSFFQAMGSLMAPRTADSFA